MAPYNRSVERRAQELFEASLSVPLAERPAFLREESSDDPRLRAAVEELLEADRAAAGFLDVPVIRPSASGVADPVVDFPDLEVGPYRVLATIGRGGTSRVYLGRHTAPGFELQVAIKVLRRELVDDGLRDRFRREQALLASLDHPNVARIYDVGTTREGLPYFVMEYVDGTGITEFADERRLPIEDRLELFCQVCAAVQHAHHNLIVHRDLKPANILVTGDGQPKLLDFGIAKLLDPSGEIETTRTHTHVLTPSYASPEHLGRGRITTAADVYSLGVVLYELLSGRRPYDFSATPPARILEVLAKETPPLLSRHVVTVRSVAGGAEAQERRVTESRLLAEARSTTAEGLRRSLSGDLETVVRHAMHFDPTSRYSSVEQLREDVRRVLEGRTVRARAATATERLFKFVRRHRLASAATSAAVIAVLTLASVTTVQTWRLTRERDRVERERARAEEITRFLLQSFEGADPERGGGKTVTAPQILARGEERIDDLADEPELQAALMHTIGVAYRGLGDYERAQQLLERAVAVRRRVLGDTAVETAKALNALAVNWHFAGDYEVAVRLAQEALSALRASSVPDTSEIVLDVLTTIAGSLMRAGSYEEAEALNERIIATLRGAVDADPLKLSSALNNQGHLYEETGRLAAAENLYREAYELRRSQGATPARNPTRMNLANVLTRLGRYQEAESLQSAELEHRTRLLGERHPETLQVLNNLGVLRYSTGSYEEAEQAFREALAGRREVLGTEHPSVAPTINNLMMVLQQLGKHEEAVTLAREALALYEQTRVDPHPELALSRSNLAVILTVTGEWAEAEELLTRALSDYRSTLGDEGLGVSNVLHDLGILHYEQGRLVDAEARLREALAMRERTLGGDHPEVARTLASLGETLSDQDRLVEGRVLAERAVAILDRAVGEDHPDAVRVKNVLASIRGRQGEVAKAEEMLLGSLRELEEVGGVETPQSRDTRERLIELYRSMGRSEAAEAYRLEPAERVAVR